MKNKWPKRAPALLAAVALTASMFPTGALALEAERQDTAETVTAAVQQTPTPTIAVENAETGNTATPETAAEPETQLQEETVEQEESAIQTAETAALQQEPEAETAVQALAAEPDSLGKVWLTEIFPNDFDNRNKNEYGTTDDRFEYIELINTADTPVNLTTDYELVYGTKADNTNPFAVQETDGSDVVLQPGEVTVVWNQRTNVKKPGTVEDFRSNYMIPDNVHIVISKYGEDWANTGYFGLRARATGTVCADYSYVNGTIDKNDGKDYLVALNGYPLSGQAVEPTGERYPVDGDGIRLLAPVIPSKVYGLAKNYEAHAQFMHEAGHSDIKHAPEDMVIFTKPSTSVIGPDDPIVIPLCSNDMNFEPELAVVMGRIAKNVPVEQAMDYVLGFTCVNDVTLRDLQGLDPMWTRAKGFDTACPLGPWIVTRDDVDWKDAKISFTLNGEDVPMASGTTANLIHGIPEQIAAITSFTTLLPGDVIMTGTPNASGHLDPGDEAIVHVEGIGDLRNVVVRC